jgi:TrmH family RNA methyltransferase
MLSKNRIKQIQSLQLKKNRDLEKQFIAEGKKTVLELVSHHPKLITEIFATPDLIKTHREALSDPLLTVTEVTEAEFARISLQATPAGIMTICAYFNDKPDAFDFETGFSFYLDDIRDPGNFGTIIRLADWFGITAIFCSHNCCDVYNPKVIQATMGAFLRVQVVYVDLPVLLEEQPVKQVYGAVLNGKNVYNEKLKQGLILIGNEANGISDENLKHVNRPITIPASRNNGTESLNAAMAASIIASEFFRQLNLEG